MLTRRLFIPSLGDISDLKYIKSYFYARGVEISLEEAEDLWVNFSYSRSAGWLCIDEELLAQCFMESVENANKYYEYDKEKKCLVSK